MFPASPSLFRILSPQLPSKYPNTQCTHRLGVNLQELLLQIDIDEGIVEKLEREHYETVSIIVHETLQSETTTI